jgi:hypothetical protein
VGSEHIAKRFVSIPLTDPTRNANIPSPTDEQRNRCGSKSQQ